MIVTFTFALGARVVWQPPFHPSSIWRVHQRNYWDNDRQVLIHYALLPEGRPLAPARWVREEELRPAQDGEGDGLA